MPNSDDRTEELPTVSVVIPVYNDASGLQRCLEGLLDQTYPTDKFEILVVDNGSEDHPEAVVSRFEPARLIVEPTRGSYAARNRGIREASGELVAFTDADCIPTDTWLERGISHLIEDERIGLVGGRIDVQPADADRPTGVELADMLVSFQQQRFVEEFHFAATASAFTRREVFEEVGLFDEALMSGGDREWGGRVADAGFVLEYAADAVVMHAARSSLRQLCTRLKRLHAGARDRRESIGEGFPLREFLRNLVPPIGTAWRLYGDQRVPGRWAWVRMVSVLSLIRLMAAWFLLRYALGGRSPRQ